MHVNPAQLPADWEISFSTMWQGLICPRRVAYDRTGRLRSFLARPSLTGALGHCAHTLLSRYAPASVEDREFEAMWNAELAHAAAKMQSPGIGRVPEPTSWPGYWLTYRRLRARLVASGPRTLSPAREPRGGPGDNRSEARLRLVERELRDTDRLIVGRPDLVYQDDQGFICVRDYKTGTTVSPERESAQVHLYAHLVEVDVGIRVTAGEIDRLKGRPQRIGISQRGVEDVVLQTVQVRSALLEPHLAGATTAEACSGCPYRLVCTEVRVAPDQESVGDVEGTAMDLFQTADGRLSAVVIDTGGTAVMLGGLESREIDIQLGERLIVMGSRGSVRGQGLLAEWSTIVATENRIQAELRH